MGFTPLLKNVGFRWFPTLSMWGLRGSRDRMANTARIEQARTALENAGHTVTISIDNTHRDTATVEAARAERQADRVAALEHKADRRHATADAAWDRHRSPPAVR